MFLFILLLLSPLSNAEDCEPGFADSCFSSVQDDLKFMINLDSDIVKNISQAAITDLCVSLDDALNCTTDIIDEDCSEDQGRDNFDSWVKALRAAYTYICEKQHQKIKTILQGIGCWNVNTFLSCTEDRTDLGHIRELLHTPFVRTECQELLQDIESCRKNAETGSCREQNTMHEVVKEMIGAFFSETPCENIYKDNENVYPKIGEVKSTASRDCVATLTLIVSLIGMFLSSSLA